MIGTPAVNHTIDETVLLGRLVAQGRVRLWRGRVISKEIMNEIPGPYPVYSSSIANNGLFGSYGRYMFDEELITWSVDGGGNFFYRPKHKFSVTNVTGILRILDKGIDCKYLFYFLDHAHKNLTFDYVRKAHPTVITELYNIWLPRKDEQARISEILTTVDEAIRSIEVRISKLTHIKQGLVHDLLTRGIDEHGNIRREKTHKFKDSPIGRIPQNWRMGRISQYSTRVGVGLATSVTKHYRDKGVPIIRNQNIRRGYFDDSEMLFLDPKFASRFPKKRVRSGDVLICHTGANVGDTCLVPEQYVGSQTFTTLIVSPKQDELIPNFLVHYLNSPIGVSELNSILVGAGKNNLNVRHLVDLRLLLPPRDEQVLISSMLTVANLEIDTEAAYKSKLTLLKRGLMDDLLTGKVRVNHLIEQ